MKYIPLNTGRQYVPGIYAIESECGKIYIGSAVKLRTRFMSHRRNLQTGKHDNSIIQNHFNKHGENSLSFRIIEYCEKDNLLLREQYYIDLLSPVFNIARIAGATYGLKPWLGRKHDDETKLRIKQTNLATFAKRPKKIKPIRLTKEENLLRFANMNKTPEGRKRCSDLHKGNTYWLGKKHKPETISNRMGALNGRARAVYCKELQKSFGTAREASKFLGLKRATVGQALRKGSKVLGKYVFQYAD